MKQFFKYLLATVTGIIVTSVLFFIVLFAIIGSLSQEEVVEVQDNSVMTIALNYPIEERTSKNPLDNLSFAGLGAKTIGLNDILAHIKAAKNDDRIKGIYLDLSMLSASFATLEEIRNALLDFKESDKFIMAYSELYTQGSYYLASTADDIYINPEGMLDFGGLASTSIFFKGTLEKLGIEAQVIKVGTYKSAVEPFILDKMSAANREQTTALLGSIYQHYLSEIAKSRNIPGDSLRAIADDLKVRNADDAVTYELVDAKKYKDEVLTELRKRLKIDDKKKIKAISIEAYNQPNTPSSTAKDRIAVVYAVGDIVSGEGDDNQIGSERISRAIRIARKDEKVKAVVLRVNSPGGSALASDVIWREVKLTQAEKPIIVSMGDVAASGGYYIACAADSIFAEPTTITGSIGVFGIIPNFKSFLNDKLGVTTDVVKTGQFSDLGNLSRPLTSQERAIIQQEVNKIYFTFTDKVAKGRDKSREYIDSIGQGRVWSGIQAVELGLVDKLGDIDDAIAAAANKAGLKAYKLVSYPALIDPFQSLFGNASEKISTWFAKEQLGQTYPYYQQMRQIMQQTGILARMPYSLEIH